MLQDGTTAMTFRKINLNLNRNIFLVVRILLRICYALRFTYTILGQNVFAYWSTIQLNWRGKR